MKVLLVEDYPPLQKSVSRGLREAGFAVDATGDGEEALWYARSGEHDAIVLDLMLPKIDGLTILRRLRAEGSGVPVLILTAKDTVEDRVRGLDLGADDYLVKPFAFEELLARVRALVRRKYDTRSPAVQVGDLVLDTAGRTARRDDEPIPLTPREYALLELLAFRAGEVVTRTEIGEHIYDFDGEPDSNVIDVYVGHLRKRLEAGGRPRLIHTRRGIGYVLAEGP
jgi:DNA-binding response OmpR family regulator